MDIVVRGERYRNQAEFEDILDSDHIGNFCTWAHDLNAKVVIVGQDYANVKTYENDQGRVQLSPITVDAPVASWSTETNFRLYQLVQQLGLDIGSPSMGSGTSGVFLTNALLCLKPGKMNDPNPARVYSYCADRFLHPLINLIEPKAVLSLGLQATRAVLRAYGTQRPELDHMRKRSFKDLRAMGRIELGDGLSLFPVYHPGAFGRMARQRVDPADRDGWQLQKEDWSWIKQEVDI